MADSQEDAATLFIRIFKSQILSALALGISDEMFQPGHEAELQARITEIVDEHLTRDAIPVGPLLRVNLIDSIMTDIATARKERFGG